MTLKLWLQENGLVVSMSESKRLVVGGAIKLNGILTTDLNTEVVKGDVVQIGKRTSKIVE